MDAAVRCLLETSRAGQLPGMIYGRLHSIVKLKSACSAAPVNAVLHEICSMVSALRSLLDLCSSMNNLHHMGWTAPRYLLSKQTLHAFHKLVAQPLL